MMRVSAHTKGVAACEFWGPETPILLTLTTSYPQVFGWGIAGASGRGNDANQGRSMTPP